MIPLFKEASEDPKVKAILFHGGRFFSSGNDLSSFAQVRSAEEMARDADYSVNKVMVNLLLAMATCKKPIVAVVRGGAGRYRDWIHIACTLYFLVR